MKVVRFAFLAVFALAAASLADSALAQEGRWAVGGIADYNIPMHRLGERWGATGKFGATLSYVASQRTVVEIEYNYSKFTDGKPAADLWVYPIDEQEYPHPNGKSEITWNNLIVNGLLFVGEENATHGFKAKDYRYYVLVGGGLYRYYAINSNLVYSRQTNDPIDLDFVMEDQIDQRYTIGANAGVGVEGFVTQNLAIDLRARYNFVVGELRNMLFYGLEKVRPIHMVDIGAQMKFYFWR